MQEDQTYGNADEIFEINDFTVVTEYERFIVQLEAILHDWNLQGRRPSALGHLDKVCFIVCGVLGFLDKLGLNNVLKNKNIC